MSNLPLVSICIFTYNHSKYIRQTIDGALSQTYENFEIVIADDCSNDGNLDIIYEYQKKFPSIINVVVGLTNTGITANANRGISACRGSYIAMVGGDDVIFPDKLKLQMEWLLTSENRVLCGHGLDICDSNTVIIQRYNHILPKAGKGRSNWIAHGPLYGATSVVVKSSCLGKPAFDERVPIVSDWKLYIDILEDEYEYGFINKTLGLYRKHSSNVTNNVVKAIQDTENCLNILSIQYSNYRKEINRSWSYLVFYGYAKYYYANKQYNNSISYFVRSIKYNVLNWKSWTYLIMALCKYTINGKKE